MSKPKTITIDDIEYVRKDSVVNEKELDRDYVIVRTYSAGVFFGTINKREGKEITLDNCQRIWKWDGACSLSQLAVDGTKSPNGCKFSVITMGHLTEWIEVIPCTRDAVKSLKEVVIWKK